MSNVYISLSDCVTHCVVYECLPAIHKHVTSVARKWHQIYCFITQHLKPYKYKREKKNREKEVREKMTWWVKWATREWNEAKCSFACSVSHAFPFFFITLHLGPSRLVKSHNRWQTLKQMNQKQINNKHKFCLLKKKIQSTLSSMLKPWSGKFKFSFVTLKARLMIAFLIINTYFLINSQLTVHQRGHGYHSHNLIVSWSMLKGCTVKYCTPLNKCYICKILHTYR